jgi:hypothetical protein
MNYPCSARHLIRAFFRLAAVAWGVAFGGAGIAAEKTKAAVTPAPVNEVTAWQKAVIWHGYATITNHESLHHRDVEGYSNIDEIETTILHFDLELGPWDRGEVRAGGSLNWNVTNAKVSGRKDLASESQVFRDSFTSSGHGRYEGGLQGQQGSLELVTQTGKWRFSTQRELAVPYDYFTEFKRSRPKPGYPMAESGTIKTTSIWSAAVRGVTDQAPTVLIGSDLVVSDVPAKGIHNTRQVDVILWPELQGYELEVEIPQYAKWMPRGNLQESGTRGNFLPVKATLKTTGSHAEQGKLKATKVCFELKDTSREPGVCMNWPVFPQGAAPKEDPMPDLQFAFPAGTTGTLRENGQKAELKPKDDAQGRSVAEIEVSAFDFGGYANLIGTAELSNGQTIVGQLKSEGYDRPMIRLPKRELGSLTAQVWREKYHLAGADDLDGDTVPKTDGNDGDGFSNYEEYRGFVENGRHIRTDPNRKDLFVRNPFPYFGPGLGLFSQASADASDGFWVHAHLQPGEMPASREMNQNRSGKSPRVASETQHALVMKKIDQGNISFVSIPEGQAWRPKNVDAVNILQSIIDRPALLASTVAHEVAHACGARHHGESDLGLRWWIKKQRGDGSYYLEEVGSVWNERTNQNEPEPGPGIPVRRLREDGTEVGVTARTYDRVLLWVGCQQGQHSGDEACIMRYDCAISYILPGRPRDRFQCNPPEKTGDQFCTSARGTAVNDPQRPATEGKPSRFGGADMGVCLQQLCVRDDAPDKMLKK